MQMSVCPREQCLQFIPFAKTIAHTYWDQTLARAWYLQVDLLLHCSGLKKSCKVGCGGVPPQQELRRRIV